MGCGVCSSDTGGGAPAGCKGNGGCSTGGCNKLNSFDWLGNMSLPGIDPFDVVEIRFKGGRKGFYRNVNRLFLSSGDAVVTESQTGHHVGFIAIQGELVRLQMRKKKVKEEDELPIIYRLATEKDLERLAETKKRELPTMFRTRQIIKELKLDMKLSDVEYQADNTKATFYYSADDRVDFRELIKLLAGEFKIRVEMRQISLRQEASRIGGIGSCGRELCCSTWLTDFQSVSTGAARYQNLSLNPNKLSGQCGRLKCCLNYELETYQDALLDIPKVEKPLQLERGEAVLQKVDIFKKQLWFSFENDSNWYPANAEQVIEIIAMNTAGKKAATLESPVLLEVEKPKREVRNRLGLSSRRATTSNKQKPDAKKNTKKSTGQKSKGVVKKDTTQEVVEKVPKTNQKPRNSKGKGQNRQKISDQQNKAGNQNRQKTKKPAHKPANKEVGNAKKPNPQRKSNTQKKNPNNTNPPNNAVPPSDKPKRPSRRRRGGNRKNNTNTPPKKED